MDQLGDFSKGFDSINIVPTKHIPYTSVKDSVGWSPVWTVDKRNNVDVDAWILERMPKTNTPEEFTREFASLRKRFEREVPVDERVIAEGNQLVNGGMAIMWTALIGGSYTAYTNAVAALGVGDSSTAVATSQTNLQASSNKLRKAMNATYPSQPSNPVIVFQSDFGSSDANFQWLEVATFNNVTDGSGTMLNRLVPAGGLGTKASGSTWTLTMQITLS